MLQTLYPDQQAYEVHLRDREDANGGIREHIPAVLMSISDPSVITEDDEKVLRLIMSYLKKEGKEDVLQILEEELKQKRGNSTQQDPDIRHNDHI